MVTIQIGDFVNYWNFHNRAALKIPVVTRRNRDVLYFRMFREISPSILEKHECVHIKMLLTVC